MRTRKLILLGVLALLLVSATLIISATYNLGPWTTSGGGGTSSGGAYLVSGVAGQAEVGPQLGGGDYVLDGGIYQGSLKVNTIFLPLTNR
jgi:hypothetical protein